MSSSLPVVQPVRALDQFGRTIEYLRISVTDRCNFRCVYCMPEKGMQWLPKSEILSYEEITEVVRQLAPLGLRRLRITGGEPTIRPQIHELIRMLRAIPEITDISLSTNGVRLPELARLLRECGLDRINMSVDSLRPDRIAGIARRDLGFDPVRSALAAQDAGLEPIKLNMVVMRGVNDHEVVDFAALTLDRRYTVRFIEFMPPGGEGVEWRSHVVPGREILQLVSKRYPFDEIKRGELAGPAQDYRIRGAVGTIGVITPVTGHFCDGCNRIRVTASGMARGCLFSRKETDLKPLLREEGAPGLEKALLGVVRFKPEKHRLSEDDPGKCPLRMSRVGG